MCLQEATEHRSVYKTNCFYTNLMKRTCEGRTFIFKGKVHKRFILFVTPFVPKTPDLSYY